MRRFGRAAAWLLCAIAISVSPAVYAEGSDPIKLAAAVARMEGGVQVTKKRKTPARHKRGPRLEVTITPPKVKIPDNSRRGTPLAKITVRWSNGEPFRGEVRLTKNTAGICQLSGMELQLSRDLTKAEDYATSVCTVTAIK